MNRWSLAPVRGIDAGDGGGFGAVGALRHVDIPGPLPGFTEVIEHADAPGRLVYRVVGTRTVRYHRGEIRLDPEGEGTRLHWDVDFVLPIAGADGALRRSIEPKLRTSIEQLAALLASKSGSEHTERPPVRSFDDDADVDQLRRDALAIVTSLDAMALEMKERGDNRQWFALVYRYVTEEMLGACDRGDVTHVGWVLRLIPGFHDYFVRSVEGPAEDHWEAAFSAITSIPPPSARSAMAFWNAIVIGGRAHIEGDLPRVLADTYLTHYTTRCDYVRFRADYLLLGAALQSAWKRMSATVPPAWFPSYVRALDRLLPPEAIEFMLAKRYFDPLAERRAAFDRGADIVRDAQKGSRSQA
jgi:Family of unknown function (DUF5995)/Polyketide cyclase / dehydrase and lipid transport